MPGYLIGFFSRRQVFHIVAYCDSQGEVDDFLKNHNRRGLMVYTVQRNGSEQSGPGEQLRKLVGYQQLRDRRAGEKVNREKTTV